MPRSRATASAPGEPVSCNTTAFLTCNHTGTAHGSPRARFYNGVPTIDQVPLEKCVGPAALVDVRKIAARGEITPTDLLPHEPSIKSTGKVVFWTGWSSRWGQPNYFDDYLVLGEAATSFGSSSRGVHLVGMEYALALDRDPHPAHYVLLGCKHALLIVENLTNLERIGREVFELIVVPLPLRGLEASPVRAIAVLPAR